MNYLFSVLMPSIIGMEFYKALNKDLTIKKEIIYYIINVLLTSIIMTIITVKLWNCTYSIIDYLNSLPLVGAKYALVAIIVSTIFSGAITVVQKMFQVELNIYEKDKRKDKKQKNK